MIKKIVAALLLIFAVIALKAMYDVADPTFTGIIAILIVGLIFVGLPVGLAIRLLRGPRKKVPPPPKPTQGPSYNLEVEVLKLARRLEGRLTAMEVVTELGVGIVEAEAVLKSFNDRGIAGLLISDSGLLVYSFRDLEYLDEKDSARSLLDA